jgi:hypothetical protein
MMLVAGTAGILAGWTRNPRQPIDHSEMLRSYNPTGSVPMKASGFIFAALLACRLAPCQAEIVSNSDDYNNNKRYTFTITDELVRAAPNWKATDENPPLSARRARTVAESEISRLLGKKQNWKLETLSLVPYDLDDDRRWIWLVRFGPKAFGGRTPSFDIYILMDGTVPKAQITSRNTP